MTKAAMLAAQLMEKFAAFLMAQPEKTLSGLADGRLALVVVPAEEADAGGPGSPRARPAVRPARSSAAGPRRRTALTDPAAVAAHLRTLGTMEEGAGYLRAQKVTVTGLREVAAALGASVAGRTLKADLERAVLNQAIGARLKFEGLRTW